VRKIGDSKEELTDPIQQAAISNSLFRHSTSLLLFPFYNPDTINLHPLMMLSIGGIINAMLLPETLILHSCSDIQRSPGNQ
jgi:hypothetical protein